MRLANLKGRAALITPGRAVDVEQGYQGRSGPIRRRPFRTGLS